MPPGLLLICLAPSPRGGLTSDGTISILSEGDGPCVVTGYMPSQPTSPLDVRNGRVIACSFPSGLMHRHTFQQAVLFVRGAACPQAQHQARMRGDLRRELNGDRQQVVCVIVLVRDPVTGIRPTGPWPCCAELRNRRRRWRYRSKRHSQSRSAARRPRNPPPSSILALNTSFPVSDISGVRSQSTYPESIVGDGGICGTLSDRG